MKKITMSVSAFGLVFDVNREVKFITADSDGMIQAHYTKPAPRSSIWHSVTKGIFQQSDWLYRVDLEGANWKECIVEVSEITSYDPQEVQAVMISLDNVNEQLIRAGINEGSAQLGVMKLIEQLNAFGVIHQQKRSNGSEVEIS